MVTALLEKELMSPFGWLRRMESPWASIDRSKKKQYSVGEKAKIIALFNDATPHSKVGDLVFHAWGYPRSTVWRTVVRFRKNKGDCSRKTRSDAVKTLSTSHKKRKAVNIPQYVHVKLLRKRNADQTFTKEQHLYGWKTASSDDVKFCEETANEWVQNGPFRVHGLRSHSIDPTHNQKTVKMATRRHYNYGFTH